MLVNVFFFGGEQTGFQNKPALFQTDNFLKALLFIHEAVFILDKSNDGPQFPIMTGLVTCKKIKLSSRSVG
jgi:hypothetical protein